MTKAASPALVSLINSGSYACWDEYTITPVAGPVVRLTTADFDAYDNSGNLYYSGSLGSGYPKIDLKQSKVQAHWKRGLDSDQWQVFILPATQDQFTGSYTYPDAIGSIPWLAACRTGVFDGATVQVARAYFASPPTPPYTVAERTPVGTLVIFLGLVGQVDADQTTSVFTINDFKSLLTTAMPRNLYQGSCRNILFDGQCTLLAATFAKTAVALAGSTQSLILANPGTPAGSQTYNLGRLVFTSGANNTFQRTVASWDGATQFQPQYPLPFAVAPGDGITFYPGCDKSLGNGGCGAGGFNNQINFRGSPSIPVPELQLG